MEEQKRIIEFWENYYPEEVNEALKKCGFNCDYEELNEEVVEEILKEIEWCERPLGEEDMTYSGGVYE